jgi:hypothetical protein
VLATDGVFDMDDPQGPCFRIAEPPEDEEILRVLQGFVRRLEGVLRAHGGEEAEDTLPIEQPWLAEIYGAAARGRVASGPRRGKRLRRLGDRIAIERIEEADVPGCVRAGGFSFHAAVAVPTNDRQRLERLCRYAARPPLALERLAWRDDRSLVYRLRHRWRDGTTHVVFEPLELIERLAMLVPPPRVHTVRYHGVLAPTARWRDRVVPIAPVSAGEAADQPGRAPNSPSRTAGRRFPWADLLARVFAVDALRCPRCSGAMRIVAAIRSPEAVRAILACLGQSTRPPPIAPARLFDDGDHTF